MSRTRLIAATLAGATVAVPWALLFGIRSPLVGLLGRSAEAGRSALLLAFAVVFASCVILPVRMAVLFAAGSNRKVLRAALGAVIGIAILIVNLVALNHAVLMNLRAAETRLQQTR